MKMCQKMPIICWVIDMFSLHAVEGEKTIKQTKGKGIMELRKATLI